MRYLIGSRGAVGGCSTPGSRVDPWWNPGSYSPSVSSPGPPRVDEGQPHENDDFQYCNNNRIPYSQRTRQENNSCSYGNNNNTSSPGSLAGYVDSTRPNVNANGSDPYGLISSSLSSVNDSNSRVDSSQNQQPATSSTVPQSPDSLNGLLFSNRIKQEETTDDRATSSTNYNSSLLSSLLSSTRVPGNKGYNNGRRENCDESNNSENSNVRAGNNLLLGSVKLEYSERSASDSREEHVKVEYSLSGSTTTELLLKQRPSQAEITAIDMKFETQGTTGPSNAPSHLTGVEPPHSSQGNQGLVVGGSPSEVVGVDSMLLSPWGAAGTEFLEAHDAKQTAATLDDAWDTLLMGSSVGVNTAQSLAELKPLPPFTGYTGHLSINGIPGHHYHTIASSAQRPALQSTSPSPSSNQEYYESSVVSSSTPCPQATQKSHHHHHQQASQQQLPQSTQQTVDYINNIEDLAEIIGSAMADTTVPGSGNAGPVSNTGNNGQTSDHDPEVSPRDWIDIAEWIDTACSPKTQETSSSSSYSQIYTTTATTTPSNPPQQQQQHGSTLQSLLTHGYSPMLQQRLQASCGETPSSTSPYPPVSPPGRVSTSCSPDHQLHSSFVTPQHPRKRSRPTGGSHPSKKNPGSTAATTTLPYGTESGLLGGKEKPVHRCSICNRGFLNKSNIKVHLRTHTGEKPFRCEVCSKAFRQKAHLIKHQQIHKRIGRD